MRNPNKHFSITILLLIFISSTLYAQYDFGDKFNKSYNNAANNKYKLDYDNLKIEYEKLYYAHQNLLQDYNTLRNNYLELQKSSSSTRSRDSEANAYQGNNSDPNIKFNSYTSYFSGHWITDVLDTGKIIKLEDSSMWRVDDLETYVSMIWLPVDEIEIRIKRDGQYTLYNLSSKESVNAEYIGQ